MCGRDKEKEKEARRERQRIVSGKQKVNFPDNN